MYWFANGFDTEIIDNGSPSEPHRGERPQRVSALLCGALLLLAAPAGADTMYSADGETGNCATCHGDFRASPYMSLSDDQSWGDDLHDVHQDMLQGDCDTCHNVFGKFPVFLGDSIGGNGLDPISCSGCHGRAEDGTGTGSEGYSAGLRQHHWEAGVTDCLECHDDADPINYTPVGEDVLPPYYSDADPNHPLIPSDPCNPADAYPEDCAATTLGLDNDGDLLYDEADLVDCPEPGETLILGVGVAFLLLVRRWHARVARR